MTKKPLKKISIQTLGCRLNQYESERMAADLYPFGFRRAIRGEKADLYLINTCTVTHRADADGRAMIRRAARANPNATIVVAGCYVESDPATVEGMSGVDVIIRNNEKRNIAEILSNRLPDLFEEEQDKGCSEHIAEFSQHNRAWLKISDGCNQWCSFCILPTVRGRLRNRAPLEIVEEVRRLVKLGFNEVVLTGIHLGHYKHQKSELRAKNLAALCRIILAETDIMRLRLSSIEPQTVRDELIEMYANSDGRICRHFHMPLQSGSSKILRRMQRPYDQKRYVDRVTAVKKDNPGTIVGADVIVGFPGEEEEDFNRTRNLCESGLLDYLHVFSYSDRSGTMASKFPDKISPDVIKERNAVLTRISHELKLKSYQRQIGQVLEVISEKKSSSKGDFMGVADNFVRVRLPTSCKGGRNIHRVSILSAHDDHVAGNII